jgi:hypothetical protein
LHLREIVRVLVATFVVAGCSWEPGYPSTGGGPVDDPGTAADAAVGPASKCKYPDPALRLCVELTDGVSPTASDSSGYHMDADASDVGAIKRGNDPAGGVIVTSDLDVAENAMLDVQGQITFETWVYISQYPLNLTQYRFMRNETQWEMTIDSMGKLRCWVGMTNADTPALTRDAWHHIACVYDGEKLKTYLDGSIAKCTDRSGPIPTGGNKGTKLVDILFGGIDDMRIYATALDGTAICSHADKSACASECE